MYLHCALPKQLPASVGKKTISIKRKLSPQVREPENQLSIDKIKARMARSRDIGLAARSVASTDRLETSHRADRVEKNQRDGSAERGQGERSTERHLQKLQSKEKPAFSRTPSLENDKKIALTTPTQPPSSNRMNSQPVRGEVTITKFQHSSRQLFSESALSPAPSPSVSPAPFVRMVRMQNKACIPLQYALPFQNFNQIEEKYSQSYQGEYQNGKREGFGTVHFSNGQKYVGGWKAGRVHGQGSFYRIDGTVLMGLWQANLLREVISELNQLPLP